MSLRPSNKKMGVKNSDCCWTKKRVNIMKTSTCTCRDCKYVDHIPVHVSGLRLKKKSSKTYMYMYKNTKELTQLRRLWNPKSWEKLVKSRQLLILQYSVIFRVGVWSGKMLSDVCKFRGRVSGVDGRNVGVSIYALPAAPVNAPRRYVTTNYESERQIRPSQKRHKQNKTRK